jgi:hypothetical protein
LRLGNLAMNDDEFNEVVGGMRIVTLAMLVIMLALVAFFFWLIGYVPRSN